MAVTNVAADVSGIYITYKYVYMYVFTTHTSYDDNLLWFMIITLLHGGWCDPVVKSNKVWHLMRGYEEQVFGLFSFESRSQRVKDNKKRLFLL